MAATEMETQADARVELIRRVLQLGRHHIVESISTDGTKNVAQF